MLFMLCAVSMAEYNEYDTEDYDAENQEYTEQDYEYDYEQDYETCSDYFELMNIKNIKREKHRLVVL